MKFRNLLVNLGLVVANAAAKWDPSGVASHLLEAYEKAREKQKLREELEALLRAGFGQFRAELADAMGDHRLQVAEGVRSQVEAYLSQFQVSARQAARLLGDPTATTVPATVSIDDPRQLAAFLPQTPPRFTVGDTVPGLPSWTLVEPLGTGGFGEVWKAQAVVQRVGKTRYMRQSAFKFFLNPTTRGRFSRIEAAALTEIHTRASTRGVVRLLAADPDQDPPWLQFEYIGGGDLSRLPEKWVSLPDPDRVKKVRQIIRELAETIGHFHALGVVHRDLKPSNILLRETKAGYDLVVADFGISKILPAAMPSASTPRVASLATIQAFTAVYASPQQKKAMPPDRRDDVYALGVLWYQLLRGDLSLERPSGDGWKAVLARMGASEGEIALLNRCWDDERDIRPANGAEFASLLPATTRPISLGVEDEFDKYLRSRRTHEGAVDTTRAVEQRGREDDIDEDEDEWLESVKRGRAPKNALPRVLLLVTIGVVGFAVIAVLLMATRRKESETVATARPQESAPEKVSKGGTTTTQPAGENNPFFPETGVPITPRPLPPRQPTPKNPRLNIPFVANPPTGQPESSLPSTPTPKFPFGVPAPNPSSSPAPKAPAIRGPLTAEAEAAIAKALVDVKSKKAADREAGYTALGDLGAEAWGQRRTICEGMLDPRPAVQMAAATALRKVDDRLYPIAVAVMINGPQVVSADTTQTYAKVLREQLEVATRMGQDAEAVTPLVMNLAIAISANEKLTALHIMALQDCVTTLVQIAPSDPGVNKSVIAMLGNPNDALRSLAVNSVPLLSNRAAALPGVLVIAGNPGLGGTFRIEAIKVIPDLVSPTTAANARKALESLRFDKDAGVRNAVDAVVRRLP
jgi:serine/threonine protein kinase